MENKKLDIRLLKVGLKDFYEVRFALVFKNVGTLKNPETNELDFEKWKEWKDTLYTIINEIDPNELCEGGFPFYGGDNTEYILDFCSDNPNVFRKLNTNFKKIMEIYNKKHSKYQLVKMYSV